MLLKLKSLKSFLVIGLFISLTSIASADFKRVDNSSVLDTFTNLQWQDDNSNELTSHSVNYCEKLSLDGHNDWRSPNVNELYTIIDFTKTAPSLNTSVFKNYRSAPYWTSTRFTVAGWTHRWAVDFATGEVRQDYNTTKKLSVRCVRNR